MPWTPWRAGRRLGAVLLVAAGSLSAAAPPERFSGVIADSECGGAHDGMRMGPTDAECTTACIDAHGASYVLVDGTRTYALSDQRAPKPFAGRRVTIVGTLESGGTRIHVETIAAE